MSAPPVNPGALRETGAVEPTPAGAEPPPASSHPLVGAFEDAVQAGFASAHRIVVQTGDGVRQAFQEAAAAHETLMRQVEGDQPAPDALWSWVIAYRRATGQAVVERLLRTLRTLAPGETLRGAFADLVAGVRELAKGYPAAVDLPDVTSLYAVQAADSGWKRLLKRAERLRRAGRRIPRRVANGLRRLVRRAELPPPVPQRRVPLRELATYHAGVRVAGLAAEAQRVTQQELAQAIALGISAVTEWTMRVLEIEHALDDAGHHQPDVIRERLPRVVDAPAPPPNGAKHDPDGKGSDGDEQPDWVTAVRAAARALHTGLTSWPVVPSDQIVPDPEWQRIEDAFRLDVEQAGTLLRDERRPVRPDRGPLQQLDRDGTAWQAWHTRAVSRLVLDADLLRLRDDLHTVHDDLLRRVAGATVEPAIAVFDALAHRLENGASHLAEVCGAQEIARDPARLADRLRSLERELTRGLQQELGEVPGVVSAHQALTDPGRPEWERMVELVARLPDDLALNRSRPKPDVEIDPSHRPFALDLRQIAADALAPALPQQLKPSVGPLRQRALQVWDQAATIEEIVHFNFSATLDELARVDDPSVEDPPSREEALEHAHSLPAEAIRRSQDTVRELTASFAEPWYILADGVFSTFHEDWEDLQRRMDADRAVEERFLGYQTRLTRLLEAEWARTRERAAVGRQHLERWIAVVTRWVRALIRRGQAVVGVAEVSDDESLASLDAIVDASHLQAALPLVYRKLFSFAPVTETALFEGRDRDLIRVRQHFGRWEQRHDTGVMIVSAPLGGGRTSFLNMVEAKALSAGTVYRVSLDERVTDEDHFARMVAAAMGLPGEPSLHALEARFTAAEHRERRAACLVDNLEHLVLQGPGGTALIERVLTFMARSDVAIYWVAAIGRDAWQFVSKTTGSATGFVTHFALQPFTAASLTDVMMSRHSRSGIPLHFLAPEHPGAILRQRLRRAKTEEQSQEILRREFFNTLFDVSDQNIGLALFYWLRAADFATRPDTLLLQPVRPLSFRFLEGFDQGRTFTLKAFNLHNTLTPDRLGRILRIPSDESAFILESLLNQRVIERVDAEPAEVTGVVPDGSYRIRRLLLHPVVRYLRHRHIVY